MKTQLGRVGKRFRLVVPEVEPMADYGFFGPDSVTLKVWRHTTTPVLGFQRAVVVEELDPALIASVDATGANYDRPVFWPAPRPH
jgi:hypothetical protein